MFIFAYGSNMCDQKLRKIVPSARSVATCCLARYRLKFHKPSSIDGSGKADAFETGDAGDEVWGVVFEINPAHQPALDQSEGLGYGYDLKTVHVIAEDGSAFDALAYVASAIDQDLRPFDWYKRYVVEGARKHRLPAPYIANIEAIPADDDPNETRGAQHRAVVC